MRTSAGLVTFVSVVAFAAKVSCGTYPDDYPYYDEGNPNNIPRLATPTPTYKFDDTDPGGYIAMATTCDLNEHDWVKEPFYAWCGHCNHCAAHLVIQYKMDPYLPMSLWNCTDKNIKFSASDFQGVINNVQVCQEGECCKNMYGYYKYSEDHKEAVAFWNTFASAGNCDDMNEVAYCGETDGWQWLCGDHQVNPSDRWFIRPCADIVYYYLGTCKLYNTIGIAEQASHYDTPPYVDAMTIPQMYLHYSLHFFPDKVCHPASYYFPDDWLLDSKAGDSASESSSISLVASSLPFLATAGTLLLASCS